MIKQNKFTILSSASPWAHDYLSISKYTDSLKEKIVKLDPIEKKTKSSVVIVNPIFKEMEELNNEIFWKTIFSSFSIGKLQPGLQFKNNLLTYKIKNKPVSIELDAEDIESSMKKTIIFLNEKVGIFSPSDILKKKLELREIVDKASKLEINSWSQFKKESHVNGAINNFIKNYSKNLSERELTIVEEKRLEDTIRKGILARYFNSSNIIVKNGSIEEFVGLKRILKNSEFYFEINVTMPKTKSKKEYKDNKLIENTLLTENNQTTITSNIDESIDEKEDILYKQWIKFLKNREKKILKYKI